ncbi:MAG: hypothetical protein K5669_06570 [Lachnospiraceae bacterium]|nr:hypothetical protein [Lachnospiraceae bacterium]
MKKKNRFLTFMVIFLLLVILTGGGLLAYKYYFASDTSYLGSWSREIDMRGYVIEDMNAWFADPTTAANVEFDDTKVTIKVTLALTSEGKFTEKIDESSFEEAKASASALALSGLISFLDKRLENAGIDKDSADKSIEELIEEALGMSASDYLAEKGPALLPTLDALKDMYNISGTYEVKGNAMRRISGGKSVCETFFVKDDYLIFTSPCEDNFGATLSAPIDNSDTVLKMLYDYPVAYNKQ